MVEERTEFTKHFEKILPSIRKYNMEIISSQTKNGELVTLPLPGRDIETWLHRSTSQNAPVVFQLHGGGLVLGDAAQDDNLRQRFCEMSGCHVLGINYRKAPENPFPAGLDDVCDVLHAYAAAANEYGMDKNRFALLGFSGGATLAAAAAVRLKEAADFTIVCQLLQYPYLDAATPPEHKPQFDTGLSTEVMVAFTQLYSTKGQRILPEVSPLYATQEQLKGCAPAAVFPILEDSLGNEGLEYAGRLAAAGVKTYTHLVKGVHHGYIEDHYNRQLYESQPEGQRHNPDFGIVAEEIMHRAVEFLKMNLY